MKRILTIGPMIIVLAWLALNDTAAQGEQDNKIIKLFNGKDLTGFYTWLGPAEKDQKPIGKNTDPEKVFTVHDGMIHVSGKIFGAVVTEKEYENYHLTLEFKWGDKTWPPREGKARNSGVLLHGTGADGAANGKWLESIECQVIEGGVGDLILVKGEETPSITADAEKRAITIGDKKREQLFYKPGGTPVEIKTGRVNWFAHDPEWKDVKGFRGKHDVEKPAGQWNRLEAICDGDKITIILNGVVVNVATKSSHKKGKIQLQSEGAEIFFRNVELTQLDK